LTDENITDGADGTVQDAIVRKEPAFRGHAVCYVDDIEQEK
jgi:hypothetical protein